MSMDRSLGHTPEAGFGASQTTGRADTHLDSIENRLSVQIERAARSGARLQDFILRVTGNNPMAMPTDRPPSGGIKVAAPISTGRLDEIRSKITQIEDLNESMDTLIGALSAIG